MGKIKIELPNGNIIQRSPKFSQCGNFSIITITYKNSEYVVNDGDEYLRGYPDIYKLKYKRSGDGKPKYIFYQEDREYMEKQTELMKNILFKDYIELE